MVRQHVIPVTGGSPVQMQLWPQQEAVTPTHSIQRDFDSCNLSVSGMSSQI